MNELTSEECRRILDEGRVAHVAVVFDGEPYVTPMSYVVRSGDLVFRTVPGRRSDALRSDPRVCVEISRDRDGHGWESIVFWGDARFVDDPAEQAEVVADLLAKYHTESALGTGAPTLMTDERLVVAVTPERMSGRSSGGGLVPGTRPGRL